MFYNCQKLTIINLKNFNPINATYFQKIFVNCTSLYEINLSKFKISNNYPINAKQKYNPIFQIFKNCSRLKRIIIDKEEEITFKLILEKNEVYPEILFA